MKGQCSELMGEHTMKYMVWIEDDEYNFELMREIEVAHQSNIILIAY